MAIRGRKMSSSTDVVQKGLSIAMVKLILIQKNFHFWCQNCIILLDMIAAVIKFKKKSRELLE